MFAAAQRAPTSSLRMGSGHSTSRRRRRMAHKSYSRIKIDEPIPGIVDESHVPYLYEWNQHKPPSERVAVVGKLPDGSIPAEGAVAGAGGPAPESEQEYGFFYSPNAISEDGSRMFFSDVGTGQLYTRKNGLTVQVSQSRGGPSEEPSPAYWRAATPNGRYVFFTSTNKLTADASCDRQRARSISLRHRNRRIDGSDVSGGKCECTGDVGSVCRWLVCLFRGDGRAGWTQSGRQIAGGGGAQPRTRGTTAKHVFIADLSGEDVTDWRDFESQGGASAAGDR